MGYFERALFAGILALPLMWYFHVVSKRIFCAAFVSYALCIALVMLTSNSLLALVCSSICFAIVMILSEIKRSNKAFSFKFKKAVVLCDFSKDGGKVMINNRVYDAVGESEFGFVEGQIVKVCAFENDVVYVRHTRRF